MAFSDMFRNLEAGYTKRVSSGPFVNFRTLFEKYKELPKKAENNVDVSNAMLEGQSTSMTDTTFNDSVSKAIQNYNQSSGQMDAKVRAALAASPNERIVRRS